MRGSCGDILKLKHKSHPKAVLALSISWFVSCTNTSPTLPDTSLFQKKQDTKIIVSDVSGFKCWQFIQVLIKYCVGKYCVSQTKHICSWWSIVYYLLLRFYIFIFWHFQTRLKEYLLCKAFLESLQEMCFTPLYLHYPLFRIMLYDLYIFNLFNFSIKL